MPIILNADAKTNVKNAAKSAYNVKFFSKDFTGTGKSIGLINSLMNPENLPLSKPETVPVPESKIITSVDADANTGTQIKITSYPIDPLGFYERIHTKSQGLKQNTCELAEIGGDKLFVEFTPVSLTVSENLNPPVQNTQTAGSPPDKRKTLETVYRVDFIEEKTVNGTPEYKVVEEIFSQNPALLMANKISGSTITIGNKFPPARKKYNIDSARQTNYDAYLCGYDLYAELGEISKIWQTTIIDDIVAAYDADPGKFPMRLICQYLNIYKISMPQYEHFYQELIKRFASSEIKTFTQVNTYLLLQDTMENMKQTQFSALPNPANIPNYQAPNFSWCSKEQLAAITSDKPLNLVQAGAGTGKSTTIKARIEHLLSLGVRESDILVLSFTNAAADNMKEKAPNIQSMTIAKMIDTIYSLNHPTHKLASAATRHGEGSTFTNTLALYADTNPLAEKLSNASIRAENKNDYATLLRLVEEEYDDIVALLDQVQQTTFQLEIILVYLEHAKLTIPFNIQHLIIDEVQDNAVFEFIFFLNLTCKLKNHLYLVGDCSQTLFEFRASDPKALSVIENGGVFETYPLNINYRSTQAVLSYANALLNDIEANQRARIQLQSFKLSQLTQQDFKDAVTVDYQRLEKIRMLSENLEKRFRGKIDAWIKTRLNAKEQICILSYSRRESAILQRIIEERFPNAVCVSIIPAKNIAFAYFSKYVSFCTEKLNALPTTNTASLCRAIHTDIIMNLSSCNIDPSNPKYPEIHAKITALIDKWEKENAAVISDYLAQMNTGVLSRDEVIAKVCETLVDFEINQNALKQSMVSQRNASLKTDTGKADFVFSTVHSAKGLEFDHVVLLYKNQNDMSEEDKRMYYVGLTRAKKSEYIIGYGSCVNAVLVSRYETVMSRLPVSLISNESGEITSVVNKDGSVLYADGTGCDTRGNKLNADGSITLASGETLTPDENGHINLTGRNGNSSVAAVNAAGT